MGLTEVARHDRAIDRRDDLGERDPLRRTSQHVAAPDTALGTYETDALEAQKDLFEVGLG
jgi:hypothetical protein